MTPEAKEKARKWAEDIVAGRAESPFVSVKPEQE